MKAIALLVFCPHSSSEKLGLCRLMYRRSTDGRFFTGDGPTNVGSGVTFNVASWPTADICRRASLANTVTCSLESVPRPPWHSTMRNFSPGATLGKSAYRIGYRPTFPATIRTFSPRRHSTARSAQTAAGTHATIQFLSGINRRIETSLPIISPPDIAIPLSNLIKSHILPTRRAIIATTISIEYQKISKTLLTPTFPQI
ncbi:MULTISPECIES: hypothetical protein [Burkholderia cepacia complex]|uniref:hypothetical protein n=1 Tax=Burkholderia cepacia complex TaxID=87882 RepID=UPI0011E4DF6E|nr:MULTISPECIES: hypothetical protein [Burkholderia cepacia complex]